MKYDVEVGQVYLAADGSKCGHLVTDVTTYADCDDVVTTSFTPAGFGTPGNRIDAFKLAVVRYYLVPQMPDWAPAANSKVRKNTRSCPGSPRPTAKESFDRWMKEQNPRYTEYDDSIIVRAARMAFDAGVSYAQKEVGTPSFTITGFGQITEHDVLLVTRQNDTKFIAQAKRVINKGTDCEEIVLGKSKNDYFIVSLYLEGRSWVKSVARLPDVEVTALTNTTRVFVRS